MSSKSYYFFPVKQIHYFKVKHFYLAVKKQNCPVNLTNNISKKKLKNPVNKKNVILNSIKIY